MHISQDDFPMNWGDRLSILAMGGLWMIKWIGLADVDTVLSILLTVVVMGYNIHKWYDYARSKVKNKEHKTKD